MNSARRVRIASLQTRIREVEQLVQSDTAVEDQRAGHLSERELIDEGLAKRRPSQSPPHPRFKSRHPRGRGGASGGDIPRASGAVALRHRAREVPRPEGRACQKRPDPNRWFYSLQRPAARARENQRRIRRRDSDPPRSFPTSLRSSEKLEAQSLPHMHTGTETGRSAWGHQRRFGCESSTTNRFF